MSNQIITISPSKPDAYSLFREDNIIVLGDTNNAAFSTTMPEGALQKCYKVIFYNIGSNDLTINFKSNSLLYFFDGSVQTLSVGPGISFELFNEPTSGKWRSMAGTSMSSVSYIRWIWEDDRLKGQVYENGTWNTCIKGGY